MYFLAIATALEFSAFSRSFAGRVFFTPASDRNFISLERWVLICVLSFSLFSRPLSQLFSAPSRKFSPPPRRQRTAPPRRMSCAASARQALSRPLPARAASVCCFLDAGAAVSAHACRRQTSALMREGECDAAKATEPTSLQPPHQTRARTRHAYARARVMRQDAPPPRTASAHIARVDVASLLSVYIFQHAAR